MKTGGEISAEKKINKTFCQKSLSVFGETHGRLLNTLKLVLANVLLFFFTLIKNTFFSLFQDFFFTKISWYYLAMCLLTIIHFKLSITKDFFLM